VAAEPPPRAGPPTGDPEPLLRFCGVLAHAGDGERRIALLDGVSFELGHGASAGLLGQPRTGKSTLLALACGLMLAQRGAVSFGGRDLATLSGRGRARLLATEIALIAEAAWRPLPGETVLDRLATSLGGAGVTLREARRRAAAALDRVEVAGCAQDPTHGLSYAQRARVQLAGALARRPRLLLVDEPLPSPNPVERERFCSLLRETSAEQGAALLVASEDLGALQGLQCLMSIFAGELITSARSQATVVPLRRRSAPAGG
jgi:energy-coupling factor transporter ATP-binding protein EcfA2